MDNKSFENQMNLNTSENKNTRLDFSLLKYFWQASPLSGKAENLIPKFLRNQKILKEFSNNELRILSKFLHLRSFTPNETIFSQDDIGLGLYLIFSGRVEIYASPESRDEKNLQIENNDSYVLLATLEKSEYFGELALLEENSIRTATAIAKSNTTLLGIFKPDITDMIHQYPVVGAKFLQSISVILANRLAAVNEEIKSLKHRLGQETIL